MRVEASRRKSHGTVLAHLLNYADGLDFTHKGNIDKHGKSGDQRDRLFENLIKALLPSRLSCYCIILQIQNYVKLLVSIKNKAFFYFLKQIKLKIPVENLTTTLIEAMFRLGFMLLCLHSAQQNRKDVL